LLIIAAVLLATPVTAFAQAADNLDCTLIVPADPLTPAGLATPYQFKATNPANGPCDELNKNQSAFVQGAIINTDTGQISIYNPLVTNAGVAPAIAPTPPVLPAHRVVAIWFGSNGNNLTLVSAAGAEDLADNNCVQNLGQNAHCNAVAFFEAAHDAIDAHQLAVPNPGMSPMDGQPCPTVRSFVHVDQDQSDNVTTTYLFTASGQTAQNTAVNRAALAIPPAGAGGHGNPSDNRLLDVFIDGALGCTPFKEPDLADAGNLVPALPLNELVASLYQHLQGPVALVPNGDPFTFDPPLTGKHSLAQVNRYRAMVDQPASASSSDSSTDTYCRHLSDLAVNKMMLDRPFLTAFRSVDPTVANTLFTFMAQRFVATYQILNCQHRIGRPDGVTLITDPATGIVIDATFP
jgi:hypothetical protein